MLPGRAVGRDRPRLGVARIAAMEFADLRSRGDPAGLSGSNRLVRRLAPVGRRVRSPAMREKTFAARKPSDWPGLSSPRLAGVEGVYLGHHGRGGATC